MTILLYLVVWSGLALAQQSMDASAAIEECGSSILNSLSPGNLDAILNSTCRESSSCGPTPNNDTDLPRPVTLAWWTNTPSHPPVYATESRPAANCYCDELCTAYGDCCVDAETRSSLPEIPPDTVTCYRPHAPRNLGIYPWKVMGLGIYLVHRCPVTWEQSDDVIKSNCEDERESDVIRRIPVTSTEGILYANAYCALCHGVGASNITYWSLKLDCEEPVSNGSGDLMRDLIQNRSQQLSSDCLVHVVPPTEMKVSRRECRFVVSECPSTTHESDTHVICSVDALCKNGPNKYVYHAIYGEAFKNIFCFICNREPDDPVTCVKPKGAEHSIDGAKHFYSLSIIMDFNTGKGSWLSREQDREVVDRGYISRSCQRDHVYDPTKAKCIPLVCKRGFRIDGDVCEPIDLKPLGQANISATKDCRRVALNQSEIDNFPGNDLFHVSVDGQVLVCTDLQQNYTVSILTPSMARYDAAQILVSVVGQVISILGLSLQLAIYCLIPGLRNLAGKNLMSLSVALLLAQLLLLFSKRAEAIYSACATVAIVTHYCFLASFAWMFIMAFDMWKTFTKTSTLSMMNDQRRKFIRYSLLAWGMPAGLVSIASCVNFAVSADVSLLRPAYGEGVCWLASRYGLIIFFALPMAAILALNMTMYISIMKSIYQTASLSRSITGMHSDRALFWLYVKLSTVMGLAWIFGFVATFADVEVLWYLYIIFNSLQGLFIFVSFVLTKTVLKKMRNQFAARTTRTSSPSSSGKTQTSKVASTSVHGDTASKKTSVCSI